MNRTAAVERVTRETAVNVTLTLDGTGKAEVSTGIGSSTTCSETWRGTPHST